MKRYKLLKDTPIAPKGEIFQEYKKNKDIFLYWLDKNGAERSTEFRKATIFNFDEWFEKAKEYKRWRAKRGERYWFARALGVNSDKEVNHYIDRGRWMAGNYFKTEKEAELYGKKLVAYQKLIDTAKKAWFEFNESDEPNWSDCGQYKYYIYYNWSVSNRGFHVVDTDSANVFGCIYFPTKESAQAIIDTMKDDLKLIFGVK